MRPTCDHTEGLRRLEYLQLELEAHYGLDSGWSVASFVCTDAEHAANLAALDATAQIGSREALPEECLLVHQTESALEVSLFLDPNLLTRVAAAADLSDLGQINDFLLAVEGVSHCVHLGWHATWERHTTAFCMELQAEVDKFLLLAGAGMPTPCHAPSGSLGAHRQRLRELHALLFERIRFAAGLSQNWQQRYQRANAIAARYCWQLIDAGFGQPGSGNVLEELRHFFRLPHDEKVRHINAGGMLTTAST